MDIFLTILGVSSLKSIWNSVPDVLFLCMTFFNKVREDVKEKDINLVNLDPTKMRIVSWIQLSINELVEQTNLVIIEV